MDETFYNSPEWRALSERRIVADGHRCTVGRLVGGRCRGTLHAHHIEPVEERPELRLEFENTLTVCAVHHPTWEAIGRLLRLALGDDVALPPCGHNHRYLIGKLECDRRRRALLLERRAERLAAA